ncbi:hypothetical protein ACE3NQ_18240 [Paenibacillus terreus]|uniref:DUF4179 domain-containing protein n=1 Tax=Paenibacillus terreus TaxID=1387834 RepID=A0ABV5BB66_9BACL
MMGQNEEQLLSKDAYEIHRTAERLEEARLSAAVRNGMVRGRKRGARRNYSLGAGMAASFVVLVLLGISFIGASTVGVGTDTAQRSTHREWSGFAPFLAINDPILSNALQQDLVTPVYLGVEKNGYELDMAGAVTDGRKIYLLYSVHNNTDKEMMTAGNTLSYGGVEVSSYRAMLAIPPGDSLIRPGETTYFAYSANLSPEAQYTKEVNFTVTLTETSAKALSSSSGKHRTDLEVAFNLDPDMLKDRIQTYKSDQVLTVAGQRIIVQQVEYTPLNSYVDLEYDQTNDKQIFELIYPVLKGTKGEESERLGYRSSDIQYNIIMGKDYPYDCTLIFKNSHFDRHDSASFAVAGISALDKDKMKLVVDLDKKRIIESPVSGIKIVKKDGELGSAGSVMFQHEVPKSFRSSFYFNLQLSNKFIDAKGRTHLPSNGGPISSSSGGGEEDTQLYQDLYDFGENAKDLPQPLTVPIERYWNPIMEAKSVTLHPE